MMASPAADKTSEFDSDGLVERLAAEFLAHLAAGKDPELSAYSERMDSHEGWQQFQRLIATARGLEQEFRFRLKPGMILANRYRLEKELGAGGMGQVWQAHDTRLDGPVALKILTPAAASMVDAEARFSSECNALVRLQHPNIVPVHDTGTDGDFRFLVMDAVDGRPLDEIIHDLQKQPRNPAALHKTIGRELPPGMEDLLGSDTDTKAGTNWYHAVARIMVEILRTLEAAHGAGVLHRDIKPGNLMLRGGGHPMLLDFGLCGATSGGSGEVSQGLYGTPVYLAPEQVKSGRVGASSLTDIYQLGAVFYEFLTLQRAIKGNETTEILDNIVRGRFEPPRRLDPKIPAELEDICLRAMELDPHRRYPTAQEFREDVQRFLRGTEVPHACRHRWLRSTRYFGRRHRLGLMAAGAVTVGVVVGALMMAEAPPALIWQASITAGSRKGVEVGLRRPQVVFVLRWFEDAKGDRLYIPVRLVLHKTTGRAEPPKAVHKGLLLLAGTHEILYDPYPGALSRAATTHEQLFTTDEGVGQHRKLEDTWQAMWARMNELGVHALPTQMVAKLIDGLNDPSRSVGTPEDSNYTGMTTALILSGTSWNQHNAAAYTIQLKQE